MQVVLLRVGIDTGSGGIHAPLFQDGTFEFMPIPDKRNRFGVNLETYGNTRGTVHGRLLAEYFPPGRQQSASKTCIHSDPEFKTFTYGDPAKNKAGLKRLVKGDLLIFYAGLKGWDCHRERALYIIGYFEVDKAIAARDHSRKGLMPDFAKNFHVRHRPVFDHQQDRLILVKGGRGSRLLKRASRISVLGKDKAGKSIHVLSPAMCRIFGNFDGHTSIQRSVPRFVYPEYINQAARFIRALK